MAVAHGEALEQRAVELEPGRGINGIHAVLLVDRLPVHEAEAALAALDEVVEASGAHHVDLDVVDESPLRDRHLGLRDRAVPGDVDRAPALEVQDAHAALPALPAHLDEL